MESHKELERKADKLLGERARRKVWNREKEQGKGKPRCGECGFRIRGTVANHVKGAHHNHVYGHDKNGNRMPMNF